MKLIYGIEDKPKFLQMIILACQQLLSIMAATLVVPVLINSNASLEGEKAMSTAAALFGAGIGTIIYILFTKRKSPVFLGSSFAFIGSMTSAFAGAVSFQAGYAGLIIGAVFAGLVYVVISVIVKIVGTDWVDKIMPKVVIGPTVAIIGLSLASNAIGDLKKANAGGDTRIAILCGIITLIITMLCSTYGKKGLKLIPFIVGILGGYAVSAIFTVIGTIFDIPALLISDFTPITQLWADGITINTFFAVPEFTFITAFKGIKDLDFAYISTILAAYVPVAFVVFAEHIADHKNISSIIEKDLLQDPGLSNTLLGDGVGSMAGAFFGGCPNTTYGESVACVAITRNASVVTIITAAVLAIIISFFTPFVALVNSIPSCVMGGVCMALYGFIAVSGLKMIQKIDLEANRNLFVISAILISGIGGLSLNFGKISITTTACSLILGIFINIILSHEKKA